MTKSTIIVGAGWAGLACAIKLIQAKHKVTIIEATPYAGGRARSIKFANTIVDNGQHLFIGAYRETLNLLKSIGVSETEVFARKPMQLSFIVNNKNHTIALPKIYAPLHVIFGLTLANWLTIKEKFLITKFFLQLKKINYTLTKDISILTALQNFNQTSNLIKHLWEPLALSAMGTPIRIASANIFFKVLRDTFTGSSYNSNWLFNKQDLNQLLPNPALQYLSIHGATILFKQNIKSLIYKNEACIGVTTNKNSWHANSIVLATPSWVTEKLLLDNTLANNLAKITYNTITTIYLLFAEPICLPYTIIGLLDGPIQWVYDRKISSQPKILSAIITNNNETEYSKEELLQASLKQLKENFPKLPELVTTKIIKEKKATFLCTPKMQCLRPTNTTNINNVFLAGDYTKGNYPATIEGAIRSGINCAREIIGNI